MTRGQRLKYGGMVVVRRFGRTVYSRNIDEELDTMVKSAVVRRGFLLVIAWGKGAGDEVPGQHSTSGGRPEFGSLDSSHGHF